MMNRVFRGLRALTAGALALCILLPGPAALAAGTDLTDVAPEAWYADAVAYCVERELMDPAAPDEFDPDGLVTRAVLAEALYRLNDRPVVSLEGAYYNWI